VPNREEEVEETLHRLEDQYVLAVILLLLSIVVYAFTGDDRIGRLVTVAVQGITLLVILDASHAPKLAIFVARVVVVLSFAGIVASSATQAHGAGGVALVGALLAVGGPVAIIHRIMRRPDIDVKTVAGALCVYLLIGLLFAYVFAIIDILGGPFFTQTSHPSGVDFVYFSFVTLTTVGYGDLTARGNLGHMLSVGEALFGQLYLVAVVALLIANIGTSRNGSANTTDEPA
jgi:hypothetical protein